MATETEQLEHRVSEIERELARLKSVVLHADQGAWWRRIVGEFAGNEEYDEILRISQELRRAERPE